MPKLIVKLGEKKEFSFDKPSIIIGRHLDSDLVIENLSVSRHHAKIELVGNDYFLEDLGSANGTFMNEEKISRHKLKDHDEIVLGKVHIFFIEDIKAEEDSMPLSPFDFDKTVVIPKIEPCYLVLVNGKPGEDTFRVDKPDVSIGRDGTCEIRLDDWLASKKHARLNIIGNNYVLTDLGSLAGTKVNGVRVKEKLLANGDIIEVGFTKLRFQVKVDKPASAVKPPTGPSIENVASKSNQPPVTVKLSNAPAKPASSAPDKAAPAAAAAAGIKISKGDYVASVMSPTFHHISCIWVNGIRESNRVYFAVPEDAIVSRHRSCGTCRPGRDAKYLESWKKLLKESDEDVREHAEKIIKSLEKK